MERDEERRERLREAGRRYREELANLPEEDKEAMEVYTQATEDNWQTLMADPRYQWPAGE